MLRTRLRQGYNDYFKVYMGDMGLFVSMLEYGTQADILSGNLLGIMALSSRICLPTFLPRWAESFTSSVRIQVWKLTF